MSNKRVTIKDVAKAANGSAMTVSNVINNQFKCVSAGTKLKVEQEILRLKYRRQTSARNLRTAHQYSVGMIVIDESPMFLTDFFTTQLVAGLANVLNNADYTMTIQGIKQQQTLASLITLLKRTVRAIIQDPYLLMLRSILRHLYKITSG